MKSSYGYLPDEKKPVVMAIMKRLASPTEEFYRTRHPKKFTVDEEFRGVHFFDVMTPLPRIWYKRKDLGVRLIGYEGSVPIVGHDVRHIVGNYQHHWWEYHGGVRDELFDCKDVFEDSEVAKLDAFSKAMEEEWQRFQTAGGTITGIQ